MPAFHSLRPKSGISARRMAVRPDVPWYWRAMRIAAAAAVLVGIVWAYLGGYATFQRGDTEHELARLQETVQRQDRELGDLRSKIAQGERQLQIERAASGDLERQVKALSFDNAALKEDLAFFQSLMASPGGRETSISVNRFRLQPEPVAGQYRYQMLLVQTGQRAKEFQGNLQFVLDVQHEGRKLVLVLPADSDTAASDYQLSFKFFQRIEGTFKLAPGTVVNGMQVRVFETGSRTPKLTQSLNVS
jgi:hypothetical protein